MTNELTAEEKATLRRINDNFKKMSPADRKAFTTALDIEALISRIKEDQR